MELIFGVDASQADTVVISVAPACRRTSVAFVAATLETDASQADIDDISVPPALYRHRLPRYYETRLVMCPGRCTIFDAVALDTSTNSSTASPPFGDASAALGQIFMSFFGRYKVRRGGIRFCS